MAPVEFLLPSRSDCLLFIQLRVARKKAVVVPRARKSERAVEVLPPLPCLHQAFGLEPLEVGQVAQRGERERLQEFSRRHIGEGGAGLRRADRAVDQAVAFQGGDQVAADLPARQFGNLPPRDRLQISDGGQREGLGPGQFGNAVPSQSGMGGANRRGEAGFRVKRIIVTSHETRI